MTPMGSRSHDACPGRRRSAGVFKALAGNGLARCSRVNRARSTKNQHAARLPDVVQSGREPPVLQVKERDNAANDNNSNKDKDKTNGAQTGGGGGG